MFPVFNIILAFFTNNMCFVCIFFILKVKKPFPYKLKAFKKRKFFRTFLSRDFGYKQSIIVKQNYYLAHTVAGGNGSLYFGIRQQSPDSAQTETVLKTPSSTLISVSSSGSNSGENSSKPLKP